MTIPDGPPNAFMGPHDQSRVIDVGGERNDQSRVIDAGGEPLVDIEREAELMIIRE